MLPNIPDISQSNIIANTYIVNRDSRSESTKCLERSGMEDLNTKYLKGEEFTDEDVARINSCINNKREANERVIKLFAIAMIVIICLGCLCAFFS